MDAARLASALPGSPLALRAAYMAALSARDYDAAVDALHRCVRVTTTLCLHDTCVVRCQILNAIMFCSIFDHGYGITIGGGSAVTGTGEADVY
jgi:hypothetical protein